LDQHGFEDFEALGNVFGAAEAAGRFEPGEAVDGGAKAAGRVHGLRVVEAEGPQDGEGDFGDGVGRGAQFGVAAVRVGGERLGAVRRVSAISRTTRRSIGRRRSARPLTCL
jgi:hypothetical protein